MHAREFGKYRILKLLPKGGMGTVYLAEIVATGERVALKLIERGPDLERQEIVTAERRGAALQAQICRLDPRIVQIRNYGDLDTPTELYFSIEMEYVDGQDLSELLRTGPLGVPFAARIALDLCEILRIAHDFQAEIEGHQYRGIVHGDIKPRNIRITTHGETRVLDFGIAKALSLTRSFTQIQFGSAQYSSPERLVSGEVTIASDLWGVAVVLWEVITSRPYFEAENGSRLEHTIRTYRKLRPMPPNVPPALAAILRKALHPDPALRYQSADAFGSDLKAFLSARPTVAESEDLPDESEVPTADLDATRRTAAPLGARDEEEAATRRTTAPSGAPAWQPPRGLPKPPPRPPFLTITPKLMRWVAGTILAIFLVFAWFVWHEVSVWRRGDELAREVQSESLKDLNAAFVRYQELQDQNHLPLVLRSPRNTILDKLIGTANRSILEYRDSETPTVSEKEWMSAQDALTRALRLDPGDREIRAKLYITEAHLARIRGTSRQSGKLLNEARLKFEAARDLMPKSPDPWIGLASLYTYSLRDVERAQDAMRNADRRGHKMGRREKGQLADGYRSRAERLLREADRAIGLPEEKDYLERAASDLGKAQDYYREIVPFGGSSQNLRRSIEFAEHVDLRLKSLREGA